MKSSCGYSVREAKERLRRLSQDCPNSVLPADTLTFFQLKEPVPRFVRDFGTGCPDTSYTLSGYTVHLVRGTRTPCTSYSYREYHIYEHGIPHIGTCHSKVSHEVQLQVQVINSQVIDYQLYCRKCRKIHHSSCVGYCRSTSIGNQKKKGEGE